MRTMVNGWNITTTVWLRRSMHSNPLLHSSPLPYFYRVCYERVKFLNPVLVTFLMSAWWHGFYPAYYCLFVMVALDIMASRKVTMLLYIPQMVNCLVCLSLDEAVTTSSLSVQSGDQMGLQCGHLVPQYAVPQHLLYVRYDPPLPTNHSTFKVAGT